MTTLRCASAALLIGMAFPVSVSASSLNYYESFEYWLEYLRPVGGGGVDIVEGEDENEFFYVTAHVTPGDGPITYQNSGKFIYFQFINYGISQVEPELSGRTVDFDNLMNGAVYNNNPVQVIEWHDGYWYDGRFHAKDTYGIEGDIPSMGGSITFDEFGLGTVFDMWFCSAWCNNYWSLSSDSFSLSEAYSTYAVTNPEVLDNLWAFDSFHFYAASAEHSLHPGQWRVASATKTCWSENYWDPVECRTPLAPVPLPASVWLLLSGLGAMSARGAWRRRRSGA